MRRRRLLATCGAGLVTSTAGCLGDLAEMVSGDRHPFAGETLSVRIDDGSDTDHDVERNAHEALEFWEEHAEEYVGFGVDFEVVDSDEPDVVIAYVDTPERCHNVENYSERVLGCAPLIRPGRRVRRPVTAIVVAGARPFGKIRVTTKHEIGHVLGLYHDDEPLWIMSNQPADRIPLYETRIWIWETVLEASRLTSEGTGLFAHGAEAWRDGQYQVAEEGFDAARTDFGEARGHLEDATDRTDEFEGHSRVETVDLDGVRSHLDRMTRRMAAAVDFSEAMAEAAVAARDSDGAQADEQVGKANERLTTFNEIGPTQLRDVAIALGLVRGFDREEPLMEVEDEAFDENEPG